jgi:DNA-binding MarR family transcriptional regulator
MESITHVFAIKTLLILLREARTMNIEEIAQEMGESHGSVVQAIDDLEIAKLIKSRNERMVPYNRFITITDSGRRVAEKLKEIEDIIGWMGSGGVS